MPSYQSQRRRDELRHKSGNFSKKNHWARTTSNGMKNYATWIVAGGTFLFTMIYGEMHKQEIFKQDAIANVTKLAVNDSVAVLHGSSVRLGEGRKAVATEKISLQQAKDEITASRDSEANGWMGDVSLAFAASVIGISAAVASWPVRKGMRHAFGAIAYEAEKSGKYRITNSVS